jgi:hypothetical protein
MIETRMSLPPLALLPIGKTRQALKTGQVQDKIFATCDEGGKSDEDNLPSRMDQVFLARPITRTREWSGGLVDRGEHGSEAKV